MMARLASWSRRGFTRLSRNERLRAWIFPLLRRSPALAMVVLRTVRAVKGSPDDLAAPDVAVAPQFAGLTEPARKVLADLQRLGAPDSGTAG